MSKMLLAVSGFLIAAGATLAPLWAQEPAPTPTELTLRPGDTITWTPEPPHRVRFGGSVTHGGTLALTPFAEVEKILDITPKLTAGADGIARAGTGEKVTAKVKADADKAGVPEFFFTCGFDPHRNIMVTRSFTIAPSTGQPARDVQIGPPDSGTPRWILHTTPGNAAGDKNLTRP
jgi:plastocyanin